MTKHQSCITAIILSFAFDLWAETNAFDTKVNSDGVECGFYFDHYPSLPWDGTGSPPINVQEARNIFYHWVKAEKNPNISRHIIGYNLWSVVPKSHKFNIWVYTINFLNFEGNIPSEPFNEHVVITMDGKIIESTCTAL